MRVLAMYLPQFHCIKENDQWWGKGFTDWVATKNALPLYEGHYQPHIPLYENYYDLLDKSTLAWQADLMKRYGVDGMCMYHYWFKDGRKILEKPAENLLQWKDIDMPFCFCWANETWARSWSNIRCKNVWANTFEDKQHTSGTSILLEQKYGTSKQWEEHFDYLLPFFKDNRYITAEGKPVFVIYRSSDIPCLQEMLNLWQNRAIENGLKGLYIIGIRTKERDKKVVDASLNHEPARAKNALWRDNPKGITKFSYEEIWENILAAEPEKHTYFGGFSAYDDTPRRGKEGCLIEGAAPERFCYYFTELMAKNAACGNDMVFLNAWNEWGEGMYLEPDMQYQYGYLEAISYAKTHYFDRIPFYQNLAPQKNNGSAEIENIRRQKDKFEQYLNLLDIWMGIREKGIRLSDFFLEKGYFNIGIYGYGILAKHLIQELEESKVNILYIVDRQKDRIYTKYPLYLPEDSLPEADVVIVAATFYFDEIYPVLAANCVENIISLEQIIYEIS